MKKLYLLIMIWMPFQLSAKNYSVNIENMSNQKWAVHLRFKTAKRRCPIVRFHLVPMEKKSVQIPRECCFLGTRLFHAKRDNQYFTVPRKKQCKQSVNIKIIQNGDNNGIVTYF